VTERSEVDRKSRRRGHRLWIERDQVQLTVAVEIRRENPVGDGKGTRDERAVAVAKEELRRSGAGDMHVEPVVPIEVAEKNRSAGLTLTDENGRTERSVASVQAHGELCVGGRHDEVGPPVPVDVPNREEVWKCFTVYS